MTTEKRGRFLANGLPVLIGSVPLSSHEEALDWIFNTTPEVPLWPQLPVNPLEGMMPQFCEGLPCIVEENPVSSTGRHYFDITGPDFENKMLAFYEEYLQVSEDVGLLLDSGFQVSRERARGLYLFAERIKGLTNLTAVKGQVTGPFTMLTGMKDVNGRAGYFDDTIRDMVVKGISMKAAWQVRFLAASCSAPVLMFIDEPALAGLGSTAFIGVGGGEIRDIVNEVAAAVHQAGGIAGLHVCANTDWSVLLDSEIDILSFDAYGFFDRIAPFQEEVASYLDRGGIIAWGGIPTSRTEDITDASTESLVQLWQEQMDVLVRTGWDKARLLSQSLITPSCGTGSLTIELAGRVLDLTRSVALALQNIYVL